MSRHWCGTCQLCVEGQTRVWLPDHHPGIVTGLSVSVLKQKENYLYLSQPSRTHGKLENLVYGTDGEPAIERAFENTSQLKVRIGRVVD